MKYVLSFLLLVFCSACAGRKNISPMPSISNEAKAGLKKPVNCSTASRDIKILEEERASVARQILSGVRSVMPIAAVAGILTGDYSDRLEVTTGEYNNDIEHKIDQIKRTCGN